MSSYINKDDKIDRFINRVLQPALDAVEIDKGNLPAPSFTGNFSTPHREGSTTNELVPKESFNINPKNFHRVSPKGGLISASDLVDLFQFYAYNLTAIRRANLVTKKLTKHRNRNTIEPHHSSVNRYYRESDNESTDAVFMDLDKVTALSTTHRASTEHFKWLIQRNPNPLPKLKTGQANPSAAINSFIERLGQALQTVRSESPTDVTVCHSSCHADCHSSRGRR